MMKRILFLLIFAAAQLIFAIEGKYDWADSKKLYKEMHHAYIFTENPRPMRINVVRADLKELKLTCTSKDPDHGNPMPDFPQMKIETKRMTVKNFLLKQRGQNYNMIAAVNATPWLPWQHPFTHKYGGNMGLVISRGEIVSDSHRHIAAFIVAKDGKAAIRNIAKNEDRSNFELALSGFELILKDGKVIAADRSIHPRTCFGISANGRYLYLLTIDGRQKGESEGATTVECAEYLRYFGADDALNMDGGGSTTLVVFDKKTEKPIILSKQKGNAERPVAVSLGIIKK